MNKKLMMWIFVGVFLFSLSLNVNAADPEFFDDTIPSDTTLYEDTEYYYDVNASDPDPGDNDTLVFTDTTDLFDINISTGVINFTPTNSQVGIYNATTDRTVDLVVKDNASSPGGDVAFWSFEIVAVNDMPVLTIGNITTDEDTLTELDVNATDEEDGGEGSGNLTFWSNATLFNISSTTGEISFTPTNADVGTHYVNVSVNDSEGGISSDIMKIVITNVNDAPAIIWACNETRNVNEDDNVLCYVNATDVDVGDSVNFSSNYSWFILNTSTKDVVSGAVNSLVNFTPNDTAVGNWWIEITARDAAGETDTEIISFNISNIADAPEIRDLADGFLVYTDVTFEYQVNYTDNDTLTPDGDTIYFYDNTSLFNISELSGDINFTASSADVGIHWVNISLNDSYSISVSKIVNFTVIANNVPNITMITNKSATEDSEFYHDLSLNVTDPDNNDTFTYTDNTTLFDIDSSTGVINFTANDSFVGENWVNLSVSDVSGSVGSIIVNFTVFNIIDTPTFSDIILSINVSEDEEYYYDVNATDGDLDIPAGNIFKIDDNISFAENDTILNLDVANGEINFTKNNDSQCGYFYVNISVNDTYGMQSSDIIMVNVTPVNDMPVLTIGNITTDEDTLTELDVNATDEEDGGEAGGNLTFWSNATLFNISSTTGNISFTPTNADVGTHYVNVSVNESTGGISSNIIEIVISNINDVPSIIASLPTAYHIGTTEDVNLTFVGQGSDADGDTMYYYWYDGSVLKETDSSDSGSENYVFDAHFDTEGEHNITLILSDLKANTSVSWNLTINHTNAPVLFNEEIDNITWIQDTTYTSLDLDDHFSDVDFTDTRYNQTWNVTAVPMNTSYVEINSSNIQKTINNLTHQVTFTPTTSWTGLEVVYFIINDSEFQVESNYVTLNVSETAASTPEPTPSSSTSSGGGGGGGSRKVYESLNIIHSGEISLFSEGVVVTPVEISNTGDKRLSGITLKATTGLEDVLVSLDRAYISSLNPGENITANLRIEGDNLSSGRYEIGVDAIVNSPYLTDSVKFFVDVIKEEEMRAEARKQLSFVHDFFKTNPECLELNELIKEAERVLELGDARKSLAVSEEAINACKEIIRKEKLPYIPLRRDTFGMIMLGASFLVAFFMILGIYGWFRKRKIKKGGFIRRK